MPRYLTFATLLIPIKSIQNELQTQKFSFTVLFSDSIFFTLIISLLSTYFLWIFMSICFLDPWHIITSVHPSLPNFSTQLTKP
jgi:chitin synthase